MKHKTRKFKRITVSILAVICAFSLTAGMSASATQSSRSVALKNGYTHTLSINFGKTSGSSTFSISNGGPCDIKNSLTAVEYTSSGAFARNVASNASTAYTTSRTCTVSRKSGTSNVLKNYDGIGYNYSSTAKSSMKANTYFCAVAIGDHGIETRLITP